MSDNQISKELIEKYRREMMELSKKSSLQESSVEEVFHKKSVPLTEIPILYKEETETICQVCTENPTPITPAPAAPTPTIPPTLTPTMSPAPTPTAPPVRPQAPMPMPLEGYREDIDEYIKQKNTAEAKKNGNSGRYENDNYIEDIDPYLREKEKMERSAFEFSHPAQENIRDEIEQKLNEQAELWRQAARMSHPQRTARESDIFINTLGWQTPPVAESVPQEGVNSAVEAVTQEDSLEDSSRTAAEVSVQEESRQENFEWPSFPAFQTTSVRAGESHLDFEIRQEEEEPSTEDISAVPTAMLRPHYQLETEPVLPPELSLPSDDEINREEIIAEEPPTTPPVEMEEQNNTQQQDRPIAPPPDLFDDRNNIITRPMKTDELSESGYLWVEATMGNGGAVPVSDATVVISRSENENTVFSFKSVTNENGEIPRIELAAPPRDRSMKPSAEIPYQTYTVDVYKDGFYASNTLGVQIFAGVDSFLPVKLYPLPEDTIVTDKETYTVIPPNDLTGG